MITDNLSGAKGTTQSSAITWLSLNSSISLSVSAPGISASPVASNHVGLPFTLFHTLSARAQGSVFILIQAFMHYRHLLIIIIIIIIIMSEL